MFSSACSFQGCMLHPVGFHTLPVDFKVALVTSWTAGGKLAST